MKVSGIHIILFITFVHVVQFCSYSLFWQASLLLAIEMNPGVNISEVTY